MQNSLFKLPVIEQLTNTLSLRQQDELQILIINHALFRAAISFQGAQLLAWQPAEDKPIIWLSDKANFKIGQPIRGGVPLSWPWFAKQSTPSHGFARTQLWTLLAHDENTERVSLTFKLSDTSASKKIWPFSFSLFLRFTLSKSCQIELESFGDHQAQAALHSYFAVSDSQTTTVSGLGHRYIDKVRNNEVAESTAAQSFNGEVDRIFTEPTSRSIIHTEGESRSICVTHEDNSDVVTWNPGAALANSMSDMAEQGYRQFVCVETARITTPMKSTEQQPSRLAVHICPID